MKHDEIKSSQINEFFLKQRQGLKVPAAPLYPWVPLTLPPTPEFKSEIRYALVPKEFEFHEIWVISQVMLWLLRANDCKEA